MSTRTNNVPWKSYVILGIICLACFAYFLSRSDQDSLKSITLHLSTGIFVVLLTIFLIDYIKSSSQEKERKKYQSVALQQLETPLIHQLYLLFHIFKSSLETKPQKTYRNVRDLFDDTFFDHLAFFDFSKEAPIYGATFGGTQWFDYISHDCKGFVDALNRTLSKYSIYLDSEIVEIMEHIINLFFIKWVLDAPVLREIAKNEGFKQGSWNLLAAPSVLESVHEYTGLFTKLVEHYNGLVTEEKKILIRKTDDDLWRNDFIPIGSGRITQKVI